MTAGQSNAAAERSAHVTRETAQAGAQDVMVQVAPGLWKLRVLAEVEAERERWMRLAEQQEARADAAEARIAAARAEERERIAAMVDCGCAVRDAVLARLAGQGEKRAAYLCTHGDACCALQAAAIRALVEAADGE